MTTVFLLKWPILKCKFQTVSGEIEHSDVIFVCYILFEDDKQEAVGVMNAIKEKKTKRDGTHTTSLNMMYNHFCIILPLCTIHFNIFFCL